MKNWIKRISSIVCSIVFCFNLIACKSSEKEESKNIILEQTNYFSNKYYDSLEFKEGTITTKDNKVLNFYAIAKAELFPDNYFAQKADYLILTYNTIKLYAYTRPNTGDFKSLKEIKEVEIAYWSLKDGGTFVAFYFDKDLKKELSDGLSYCDATTTAQLPERVVMSYEKAISYGYIERNSNKISFKDETRHT